MEQYARFCEEFNGDQVFWNDVGWVQYRYLNDRQVYIVNIWVDLEQRKEGQASALADKVVGLAKLRGCTELVGTVVPSAKSSTASLKVLLGYGMRVDSSANDLIMFKKEI